MEKNWKYTLIIIMSILLLGGIVSLFFIDIPFQTVFVDDSGDSINCQKILECGNNCQGPLCAVDLGDTCDEVCKNFVDCSILIHNGQEYACVFDTNKNIGNSDISEKVDGIYNIVQGQGGEIAE